MNSSTPQFDRVIDEQAATWAARLDGDILEASERAELDAWLAQSPTHRAALSHYCQFSADLEERLPRLVATGAIAMPAPRKPRKIWSFPRVGFALAAAAAIALVFWTLRPAPPIENIVAPLAMRTTQTLADGTRVELNAHTSLRFENGGHERHVRLAGGGEALFMVTKDKSRPFIVETPAGLVRVTGTTFNVRTNATASALDVTVVEGSVQVRPREAVGGHAASAGVALRGGERLSARNGTCSKKELTKNALDDELAWRTGQVVFIDVPLSEAAERFAHYHGRSITVAPEIASERIGGRYSLDDLPGFLSAINFALPVDASFDENGAASIVAKPRTGSESPSPAKP